MWKEPPEPLLEKIADTLFSESDRWKELLRNFAKGAVDIKPNVLSLKAPVSTRAGCFVITVSVIRTSRQYRREERFHFGKKPRQTACTTGIKGVNVFESSTL